MEILVYLILAAVLVAIVLALIIATAHVCNSESTGWVVAVLFIFCVSKFASLNLPDVINHRLHMNLGEGFVFWLSMVVLFFAVGLSFTRLRDAEENRRELNAMANGTWNNDQFDNVREPTTNAACPEFREQCGKD